MKSGGAACAAGVAAKLHPFGAVAVQTVQLVSSSTAVRFGPLTMRLAPWVTKLAAARPPRGIVGGAVGAAVAALVSA